jgi:hypothetical protein
MKLSVLRLAPRYFFGVLLWPGADFEPGQHLSLHNRVGSSKDRQPNGHLGRV